MHNPLIVHLIRSRVLPWTIPDNQRRLIVARPDVQSCDMPEGVTLSQRELSGRRIMFRGRRAHSNQQLYTAFWPDDNLEETAVPRISCVVSGTADILIGQYLVTSNEGIFYVIPPGMPRQCRGPFLAGERLEQGYCAFIHVYAYRQGVWLWYTTSHNRQHVNEYKDNYLIYNASMARLLEILMDEVATHRPDTERVCLHYLGALFTLAAREIESDNYIVPGPKIKNPNVPHPGTNFTQQVQEFIEANCHAPLKVEDAARHMYMSSPHFFRRMRQETGMTFGEMLTRCRVEQACYMLHHTDLTITAIARMLSFKSVAHFQSLFKVRMDCTPTNYRQRTRAGNPSK